MSEPTISDHFGHDHYRLDSLFQHFQPLKTTVGETVFPAIRQLESTNGDKRAATAQLKEVFAKLEAEHENADAALAQFKALTDGYTPPEWTCNTFRALYDGLEKLEKHTHQHVHQENNILFPRALAVAL